jgi:low temperature requirement protein LtrA
MHRHLRQRSGEEQAATFLELFFDLVFVFAVTQLAHHLVEHLDLRGVGETLLLLLVVWWAWIYTTWMTNWFDPDAVPVRLVLIAVMLASLLMAVAIPDAFGDRALLFAGAYAALQVVRNAFIVWAAEPGSDLRRSFARILAWSGWVSVIWLAGAVAPEDWRVPIWLAALACDYLGPYAGYRTPGLGRSRTTDWEIEGGHFAERFQLFVIIALGESIVVTGATAADRGLDLATIAALATCFVGSAALWWLYFDAVARHSRERLRAAQDRGRLARDAFTYLHVPIVAGIIASAVADEITIAHPGAEPDVMAAAMLVGGPLLYLLGHQLFRLRMVGSVSRARLVAIAALALLLPFATAMPALAAAAAATLVLCATATVETLQRTRTGYG